MTPVGLEHTTTMIKSHLLSTASKRIASLIFSMHPTEPQSLIKPISCFIQSDFRLLSYWFTPQFTQTVIVNKCLLLSLYYQRGSQIGFLIAFAKIMIIIEIIKMVDVPFSVEVYKEDYSRKKYVLCALQWLIICI